MRAVRVHLFGDPSVMKVENVPDLVPQAGQVVVEVKAAGVNPVDTYIRTGTYALKPALPYTPGIDGAGIVKAVGKDVSSIRKGMRVYMGGSISGTYAEQALCREEQVFPLSEFLSFEEGAGIYIPYTTAYNALVSKAQAQTNETILIHGASGAVGIAALQLARQRWLTVLATAGSDEGVELITRLGVHQVSRHDTANYQQAILDATQKKGVDIILEMLANVHLGEDLMLAAHQGRVVIIGCRGEVTINPRLMMQKDLRLSAVNIFKLPLEEIRKIQQELATLWSKEAFRPVIGKSFLLTDVAQAHLYQTSHHAFGKNVIIH